MNRLFQWILNSERLPLWVARVAIFFHNAWWRVRDRGQGGCGCKGDYEVMEIYPENLGSAEVTRVDVKTGTVAGTQPGELRMVKMKCATCGRILLQKVPLPLEAGDWKGRLEGEDNYQF